MQLTQIVVISNEVHVDLCIDPAIAALYPLQDSSLCLTMTVCQSESYTYSFVATHLSEKPSSVDTGFKNIDSFFLIAA
jgi:hypothetical protein